MKKITQQLFYKLLFSAFLCGSFFNVHAQTPSNNTIANATKITSLPFTDSNVNVLSSNSNNLAGFGSCSLTNKSVVYKFTPTVSGNITVNIVTYIATAGAAFTTAANENATHHSDLALVSGTCTIYNPKTVAVTAGQTYYIILFNNGTTTIEFTGTAILSSIPTVTTTDAESITSNSATLGGTITSNNGFAITERGVVYSSSDQTPEIGETGVTKETEGGTSVESFSESITGLSNNTTYYFRSYATNSQGTAYGTVKTFTTTNPIPVLSTSDASSITKNSVSLGGNITSDNGNTITERGVVYSMTDTTPEIGDTGVTKEIEGGTTTGAFSETISGLTKGSTYYFRAYAINSQGTGYGDVKSFTTLKELPTVTTTDATNITATGANVGGEITTSGSSAITEKGIVYSTTNPSPRITDASGTTKVVDADAGTTFSETLTSLTTTNVYYYRAYASNSQGTGYGTVKRFTLNNGLLF